MRMIVKSAFSALAFLLLLSAPASAQALDCIEYVDDTLRLRLANGKLTPVERIAEYIAVIGERDLRNSSGTRLADYRAILQQDRANVHRNGKLDQFDDVQEGVDDYFTTLDRRKLLSTGPYYFDCWMTSETITSIQKDIQSGQLAGVVSVMVIRLPDGRPAVTITVAG